MQCLLCILLRRWSTMSSSSYYRHGKVEKVIISINPIRKNFPNQSKFIILYTCRYKSNYKDPLQPEQRFAWFRMKYFFSDLNPTRPIGQMISKINSRRRHLLALWLLLPFLCQDLLPKHLPVIISYI